MTHTYLGTYGFAALTGLAHSTVMAYRSRGVLPAPDAIIQEGGAETWGWTPETIERWTQERAPRRRGKRHTVARIENIDQ